MMKRFVVIITTIITGVINHRSDKCFATRLLLLHVGLRDAYSLPHSV